LLNGAFVLREAFRTFGVRINGPLLSTVQVRFQPVSLLVQSFQMFEMVVLKFDPVLLLTLLL
jgi:hypothetical protein